MKTIPLTKGRVAIVDDEDFKMLSSWSWCLSSGYAVRGERHSGRQRRVYMHRVVLRPGPGLLVDHISGDTLDNRRCNLRPATSSQNNQNRRMKTAKPRGVSYDGRYSHPWRARIVLDGQRIELGRYASQDDAAAAYDAAARRHFGAFATLNFPERT